jgi:hypothetical protein
MLYTDPHPVFAFFLSVIKRGGGVIRVHIALTLEFHEDCHHGSVSWR